MNPTFHMKQKINRWILAVLVAIAYPMLAIATSNDASSPIDIAADSVEINENQNTSTYTGKVEVQQGSMHLLADHIAVQHQPSRQPERIVATGSPSHYQQTERDGQAVKADAKRMEYDVVKGEIVLSGDARLNRNRDSFSSDRITYDRNQGIIKAGTSAQGHQRVHITIVPDSASRSDTKKHTDVANGAYSGTNKRKHR